MAASASWPRNIADDLRAACDGHRPVPVRDHGHHRRPADRGPRVGARARHPAAEGLAAWAARAGRPARAHAAACRQPRRSSRPPPIDGSGRPARARLGPRSPPAYGVPYVRAERCADADEAVAAAERLGYPVVVKVDNVAHKARVGGVALGLADAAGVREAAERMGGRVIVAEQVSRRRRGAGRRSPATRDYGATVVGRHRRRRWPRRSTWSPPAWRRWTRRRPRPGAQRCRRSTGCWAARCPIGLIDAIVAVSRLAAEHPEISEIDINPLLVSPERAVALDCLIVLDNPRSEPHERRRPVRDRAARPPGSR